MQDHIKKPMRLSVADPEIILRGGGGGGGVGGE